jgi:hypothetical protein
LPDPESIFGASKALRAAAARGVKAGLWIRHFTLAEDLEGSINTDPALVANIIFILSHASLLTEFAARPSIAHFVFLSTLSMTCAQTLTLLDVSIAGEPMDFVVHINELKCLVVLNLGFPVGAFDLPSYCQPWDLPLLKEMACWTNEDSDFQLGKHLIKSHLPVIESLHFKDLIEDDSGVQVLLDLYNSKKSTLKEYFVNVRRSHYARVILQLSSIERLVIQGAKHDLVSVLPPSVSKLHLRCNDTTDIVALYAVLDTLLSNPNHSVEVIQMELNDDEFIWVADDDEEYIGDGSIHHGNLIRKLLAYTSKGLKIVDEKEKTILDYIPWR